MSVCVCVCVQQARECGMQLVRAVIDDSQHVHTQADALLNAALMEYPFTATQVCGLQREAWDRIGKRALIEP